MSNLDIDGTLALHNAHGVTLTTRACDNARLRSHQMVYIPPPQIANGRRPSYAETYSKIVAEFRSSPLTSASSIIILVALDVDALCAARMLGDLFTQDDVIHRILPVSGFSELEKIRGELLKYAEVRRLPSSYLAVTEFSNHSFRHLFSSTSGGSWNLLVLTGLAPLVTS